MVKAVNNSKRFRKFPRGILIFSAPRVSPLSQFRGRKPKIPRGGKFVNGKFPNESKGDANGQEKLHSVTKLFRFEI